jgi:light-regulated signal transduction histidine kinase (bacteriophytochrome)
MTHATRLFSAFQRLHHSGDFPGTGIGLAIVRRIMNRHDGEIWAEAKEGEGATFFFALKEFEEGPR